jgi:hypothetical protein
MGLHIVGSPKDYGGDDNPPEHGRDTAIYQELIVVQTKYEKWLNDNWKDLFNDEMVAKANLIKYMLEELSDELKQPL